jgi:hypothetical protein
MHCKNLSMCDRTISSRVLRIGLAALVCVSAVGCGTSFSTVPSAGTKAAPGVPGGAMLGYFWSSSDSTLRPLLGVSGSAQVGQSIVPAGSYVSGAASTASGFALVEDAKDTLFLLNLPSSQPTMMAASVAPGARIAFSPSGGVAIAYAQGGSSVTLISGLSAKPSVTQLGLPSGAKLGSAIVSDAGTVLVSIGATPVSIEVLTSAGQLLPVITVTKAGGMSFLRGVNDALVADRGRNTLSLLNNVSGSLAVQALSAPGINQPLAVASSSDGRWAVVANGGDNNILRIDLKNGAAPSILTCFCQPNQLSALAGSGFFRLNDLGNGPLWTVDVSGSTPELLFVPAIPIASPSTTVVSTASSTTLLR